MNKDLETLIATHIELIDNEHYEEFFLLAINQERLETSEFMDLVDILNQAGINTLPYQQEVLKDKFQQELDYWGANFPSSNYINLSTFCEDFLANLCGLSFNELRQFVKSVDWNGFYINNSFMIFRKRD